MSSYAGELPIRDAVVSDAPALTAFAATLFRAAYGEKTRAADLESYIAGHFRPEIQAAEIAAAEYRTFLLELDGELAGYAQMWRGPGPSCLEQRADADAVPVEIRRFYVAPSWRGRGVAQGLMAACLRVAPAGTPVWLGVFTFNTRAIAFYTKCGFRIVGNTTFWMGDDPQHDNIMQWMGEVASSDGAGGASHHLAAGDTSR